MQIKLRKCPCCRKRNITTARYCEQCGALLFPRDFKRTLPHKSPDSETCVIIYLPGVIEQAQEILEAKRRAELEFRFTPRNIVWVWIAVAIPLLLAHMAAYLSSISVYLIPFVFLGMPLLLLRCVMFLYKRLQDIQFAITLAFTSFCANLWGFASAVSYGNIPFVEAMRLAASHGITYNAGVFNWCIILTLPLTHVVFAVYRTVRYAKGHRSPY